MNDEWTPTAKAIAAGLVVLMAVVAFLAVHVYPFDYGVVESALLAGAIPVYIFVDWVMNEASF